MRPVDRHVGDQGTRARRRTVGGIAVSVGLTGAIVALAMTVGGVIGSAPAGASNNPLGDLLFPTTTTTTAKPKPKPKPQTPVPDQIFVASPMGQIPTFDRPGGTQIGSVGYWYGRAQTMPVLEFSGKWARIMAPERPNGKSVWVGRRDVVISTVAYRIVIRRSQTKLTVYQNGWPIYTVPAGLGVKKTPTPLGSYYITDQDQANDGYGPIILDTSAHSEAIRDWQHSGDALIAIHGPISKKSDKKIGANGTYISNGCVRLHAADSARLASIPPGTPLDIIE